VSEAITRVVVTDANVLINLLHVARLDLLSKLPGHEFVVPDHVREEITNTDWRALLDAAVAHGRLKLAILTELDAITVFTELIVHIGRGEAACIAIAAKHGWCIASDEKRRFRREAVARIGAGRLLGTADIFVAAIGAGLLSVEEADADKLTLEERRFKMSFGSYRELVT
jgi:predicted nucleic acid-binding protein